MYDKGVYQYIEIYYLPDTSGDVINLWKSLGIPYVIHAPHYQSGLNLAKSESKERNMNLIKETMHFADSLSVEKIIVHPGVAGDINETARQLIEINDHRLLVENKPYYALFDGLICNGATAGEIGFLMNEASIGCCLDIGHAFCAARGLNKDPMEFIDEFFCLKPEIFHLTDGDYHSAYDRHDHIGEGNYDIKAIMKLIPDGNKVTVETVKDYKDRLNDFEDDICNIKCLI
ncbi:MAG: TIM barrel protein [Nitrospirae bacterium]|nr:TIM barrel protein [Nitrospirota bacterium]